MPAPYGTSSSLFAKHLNPLLTVPQHQGIRWAVCIFIVAPVDVFEDACQHGAPLAIPRQLWLTPYKQGSIVYSPSEVLKVAGVIEVHLQHGICHAMFFHPSSAFLAAQCGKTEDFICHHQFLINPPMAFHLIINVEELVKGIEQHFWSVALMQNILILWCCMVGILKLVMPLDLCFQSSSVVKENVLSNLHLNMSLNVILAHSADSVTTMSML